jgi:hypothetical protein
LALSWESLRVERGAAGVPDVLGRYLALDERGVGLRATWRPASGFTNVSLWRGEVCVETFHLSPEQMGELVAFLGMSLATAHPGRVGLRLVEPEERAGPQRSLASSLTRARASAADLLHALANRIHPSR